VLFMYCGCVVCLCTVSCVVWFMYSELCGAAYVLWLCSVVYVL
jgi:hypothetical protein